LAQGVTPSVWAIGYFFLLSLCLAVFIIGISLAIAPLHVLFRDLGQIWEVVLTLGFYGAPIIYSLALIPEKWQPILWLNPVGYIIHFQREALLFERYADISQLGLVVGVPLITLMVGGLVYARLHAHMVDYL